ncbi:MAG TPA: HAMP domain-containing sensor histidine kinase [Thermomicrobiales bacterium]|nr:HAMP domain-containing sensor histidine kinase [Thermomicrobiales bacterium]
MMPHAVTSWWDWLQRFGGRRRQRPLLSGTAVPGVARGRFFWYFALLLALALVAWAVAGLAFNRVRLATVALETQVGMEAASALARLFGALVLALSPAGQTGQRLRWVAGGLAVLGVGRLLFGYVPPLVGSELRLNTLMYAAIVVWTMSGLLFVVGLVPARPPRLTGMAGIMVASAFIGLNLLCFSIATMLPPLVRMSNLDTAAARGDVPLPGLTAWHWTLSLVPLGLAIAATLGTAVHLRGEPVGNWLLIAMTLLAGSQLHHLLWPAPYGPILTSANLLRLAFAVVVVVGGVLELRRTAAERATLLAAEQEYSRRLVDLARVKADFTAMAAHELGAPVAAISGWADVLATGELSPEQRDRAIATIRAETKALNSLVADVRTVINAEGEEFAVFPVPVSLEEIVIEAVAFARVLPDDHWISWSYDLSGKVWADPLRIGQVLRNLLSNAAKYSAPDAPIDIRVHRQGQRVRIEVVDAGYGIHPDDLTRVFEKFGRGRDTEGRRIQGVGLGLYLSQRIILAHGSTLTVSSTPGEGSVFGFDLEAVP